LDTGVVGFVGFRVCIGVLNVARFDVADVELDSVEIDDEVGGGFCELVKLGFEVVDGMDKFHVKIKSRSLGVGSLLPTVTTVATPFT